jgi:hypothetical protein
MTAASVMFMMSDRSQKFSDWSNDTVSEGECTLKKAQFENACDCDDPTDKSTTKSERIYTEADQELGCQWPNNAGQGGNRYECEDAC